VVRINLVVPTPVEDEVKSDHIKAFDDGFHIACFVSVPKTRLRQLEWNIEEDYKYTGFFWMSFSARKSYLL
jgi:hypothetical protein